MPKITLINPSSFDNSYLPHTNNPKNIIISRHGSKKDIKKVHEANADWIDNRSSLSTITIPRWLQRQQSQTPRSPPIIQVNPNLRRTQPPRPPPPLSRNVLYPLHCPSAVVYTFSPTLKSWAKAGLEGPLFVCSLLPHPPSSGAERFPVIIKNQKSLDNL